MSFHAFIRHHGAWAAFPLVILLLWTGTAWADEDGKLPPSRVRSLFDEANRMFDEAEKTAGSNPAAARTLFRRAALGYQRLSSRAGIENGKLYYNIGNAWFQAGDLGRAVLNYRRALQYIPNDANLRQNLAFARNKRLDTIQEPQKQRIFQTLFFWHYDLSTPIKLSLFLVFYASLWAGAALCRVLGRPLPGWPFFLALAAALLLAGSLAVEAAVLHNVRPGVILAEAVTARKGNSENYAPSFAEPLHAGTEFELEEVRGRWYHVKLSDGRQCWIPQDSAGLVRDENLVY